ncbi:hypothetical protein ASPWEDRAFT_700844 [Aspergillus wentii DTO 134E9]|uniref:Uncharacterized protein n=1 Tax=Aspergillus wentii DTO 134E9 TaxID=1073089 RepID=A0A1L9R5C9_ASPWE|nr:uncharacterized protein ASPWEDRAFT_700844 [Aspergillus wentii DTO 134E9]OJJ30135.1 hypothetical protein ASPWEDRAFT_700844 [Aspergillus wentii DTO 134E9]
MSFHHTGGLCSIIYPALLAFFSVFLLFRVCIGVSDRIAVIFHCELYKCFPYCSDPPISAMRRIVSLFMVIPLDIGTNLFYSA